MNWFPQGWFPEGHFPDNWFPGDSGSGPTQGLIYVPAHRTVRAGALFASPASKTLAWPSPKLPDEPARYRLDFTREVEKKWERRQYTVGERISAAGFDAVVTKAGLTGVTEPVWPGEAGRVVKDGSLEWTLANASSQSLITLATEGAIEWDAPEGVTVQDPLYGPISTSAVLLAEEPGEYRVVIKVRYANGEGFDQPCILTVV